MGEKPKRHTLRCVICKHLRIIRMVWPELVVAIRAAIAETAGLARRSLASTSGNLLKKRPNKTY